MEIMLVCLVLFGKAFIKVGVLFGAFIIIESMVRKIGRKRRISKEKGV